MPDPLIETVARALSRHGIGEKFWDTYRDEAAEAVDAVFAYLARPEVEEAMWGRMGDDTEDDPTPRQAVRWLRAALAVLRADPNG